MMDHKLILPGTIVRIPTVRMGPLARLYGFGPEQFVNDPFRDGRFRSTTVSIATTGTTFGPTGPTYVWVDQNGILQYRQLDRIRR